MPGVHRQIVSAILNKFVPRILDARVGEDHEVRAIYSYVSIFDFVGIFLRYNGIIQTIRNNRRTRNKMHVFQTKLPCVFWVNRSIKHALPNPYVLMYVCPCVYIYSTYYVYVCMCTYVCVYVRVYECMCVYVGMSACMHAFMYVCTCVRVYVSMYVCLYLCICFCVLCI
jgi:hypothetical protein